MEAAVKLSHPVLQTLRCPICTSQLEVSDITYQCTNPDDNSIFPIVNGIPILINEQNSVFSLTDFTQQCNTYFDLNPKSRLKKAVRRLLPDISGNIKGKKNYKKLGEMLMQRSENPRVLVLGGSIIGQGMEPLFAYPSIEFVETDVSFGPRTKLICDAHDIPFENESFDAVIAQAVLEHVVDPYRCVEEMHRVLKPNGLVYAETPFMQQVHGGRYDFTRFTPLGHRRLFRMFAEVDSGAVCGPAMALAWSYQHFLVSLAGRGKARTIAALFATYTAWYLKYLDYIMIDRPAARDAASGCYFLGTKSDIPLPDRELLKLYNGAM